MMLEVSLLLVACAVAVCTDIGVRKIPNWLTATFAAGALAVHVTQGWVVVLSALGAGIVMFCLGAYAHRSGVLGGGDVKLLAVGVFAVGFPDCVIFLLYTFMGGGLLAIGFALAQRRLRTTFANIRALAQTRTRLENAAPSARMPYAIAIAFGATVLALADTILPALRFPT